MTLYDLMDSSTQGLPVHHQLPEFTQTHVHWVGDAIQPSHPLSSPSSPAFNLSQHQVLFKWVSSSHQVAIIVEFSFNISPSNEHSGLISFRVDWLDLLAAQFSHSVMSDSLGPHGLQHTRSSSPSPTPGVYPNSCPLSQWCQPTISSSVVPVSSCPQSSPASGSFQMSRLFTSGGQGIGAAASGLPVNIQDWFPLGWTDLISLQSKGLSRIFSNITVQKHQLFGAHLSLQSNSHIHTWPLEKP